MDEDDPLDVAFEKQYAENEATATPDSTPSKVSPTNSTSSKTSASSSKKGKHRKKTPAKTPKKSTTKPVSFQIDGIKYDVGQSNAKDVEDKPAHNHIKCETIELRVAGKTLIEGSDLVIHEGQRVGLVGRNGYGKSTLLTCIAEGYLKIPKNTFDADHIQYVRQAAPGNATSVFEHVRNADADLIKLEDRVQVAEGMSYSPSGQTAQMIAHAIQAGYEARGDQGAIDHRVRRILTGLGFSMEMQDKPTSDISGGMRMRVSLARALFMQPRLLLLDEPTNHLDFVASIWLEQYLQDDFDGTLIVVSHNRGFLDEVCTNMLALKDKTLFSYEGNYADMEEQIRKYGPPGGEPEEPVFFRFTRPKLILDDSRRRPPPPGVLVQMDEVAFSHPAEGGGEPKVVFKDVNFALRNHRDKERGAVYALVGANGGGKSTFLDLISGAWDPVEGTVSRHGVLDAQGPELMFRYSQHFVEAVEAEHGESTAVRYVQKKTDVEKEDAENALVSAGLSEDRFRTKIEALSGGERVRMQLASLALLDPDSSAPRVLLLDEPTNHLDTASVEALAQAIKVYVEQDTADDPEDSDQPGAVVLVTHDIRLLEELDCQLLVCKDYKVELFEGSIQDYKEEVLAELQMQEMDAEYS